MTTPNLKESQWLKERVLELRRIFPEEKSEIQRHNRWRDRDLPTISTPYFYWLAELNTCPVGLLKESIKRNENIERISVSLTTDREIGDIVTLKADDFFKMIWRL